MRRFQRVALSALTFCALLGLPAVAGANTGAFTITSSPNQGTSNNELLGVAAVTSSSAWAVGYYQSGTCVCNQRTLSEHWNGSSWTLISTPNAGTAFGDYDVLKGAAAVTAGNVWAVGYAGNVSSSNDKALIEHWNGIGWSLVPSPNPSTTQDLYGVSALTASDVWAVGGSFNQSPYRYGALIEHWNGTSWSAVPNPATTALYGVTAIAANDVWAVGYGQILHWNGTTWNSVPNGPGSSYDLQSVAAVSPSNIWAVGYEQVGSGEGYYPYPVVEHWNGSNWSAIPHAAGYGQGYLFGVTAPSATSVWAVGNMNGLSFAERWDGTKWQRVPTPNIGTSNNTFQAAAANSGNLWTVGEWYRATSPYQAQTLAQECVGCA
jgi:hypothetical protein